MVVGVVISFVAFSGSGDNSSVLDDHVSLDGGGVAGFSELLPLTAAAAVAAGWQDPVLCDQARGKFFQKDTPGEGLPYFLMYDNSDELIGIYQFSLTEMPPPWVYFEELQGAGKTIIDFPHWSLLIYFVDPLQACARSNREGVGTGAITASGARHAVRSYEVSSTPTPLPSPALALEAAAKKMAALRTLTFTLTGEPEGTQLIPGLERGNVEGTVDLGDAASIEVGGQRVSVASLPVGYLDLGVTVGEIVRALQDPVEATKVWIDNKPHRGLSGAVLGVDLASLMPGADPDARVTLSVWLGDDGMIRRVLIEGVVTSGDAPEAVRELDLGGFNKLVTIEPAP